MMIFFKCMNRNLAINISLSTQPYAKLCMEINPEPKFNNLNSRHNYLYKKDLSEELSGQYPVNKHINTWGQYYICENLWMMMIGNIVHQNS